MRHIARRVKHHAAGSGFSGIFKGYPYLRPLVWGGLALLLVFTGLLWRRLARQAALPDPQTHTIVRHEGNFKDELLYFVLKKRNLPEAEIGAAIQSLDKVFKLSTLNPRDRYSLTISTADVMQRLEITRGTTRAYTARTADGRYVCGSMELPVATCRRSAGGRIRGSLWNSLIEQGMTPQIIMEFADAFAWNIDFLTETRDGDRFAVVWDETTSPEGHMISQKILGAAYDGHETGLKKAFSFDGAFYAENAEELKKMFLRAPLSFRRISSFFSRRRFHPVLKIYRPHLGIDYAAPTGTPVSVVANGVITFAGRKGGFGNYIEVRHGDGFVTSYGHLSRFAAKTRRGTAVTQGQVIGYVGSTGLSSGPHLDFRIKQNGKFMNFLTMKNRSAGILVRSKIPAFKKHIEGTLETVDRLLAELKADGVKAVR